MSRLESIIIATDKWKFLSSDLYNNVDSVITENEK